MLPPFQCSLFANRPVDSYPPPPCGHLLTDPRNESQIRRKDHRNLDEISRLLIASEPQTTTTMLLTIFTTSTCATCVRPQDWCCGVFSTPATIFNSKPHCRHDDFQTEAIFTHRPSSNRSKVKTKRMSQTISITMCVSTKNCPNTQRKKTRTHRIEHRRENRVRFWNAKNLKLEFHCERDVEEPIATTMGGSTSIWVEVEGHVAPSVLHFGYGER